MRELMIIVEDKIKDCLPEWFVVVFGRWSAGDTHYVGVFATYPHENEIGFRRHLFGLSPMGAEEALDANEHYKFVQYVLGVDGKTFDDVPSIIDNNTDTNKSFARMVGQFFLGCYSHLFNLAMKDKLFN